MSSPRIAISAARDRHRRSPSARWRQAWRRRLAPQRLCDSYANPAPARIPENYGRTVWPRPARSPVQRAGNLPQPFWRLSLFREDVYETAADAGRIV